MERYGIAAQFTSATITPNKAEIETAVDRWIRRVARDNGQDVDVTNIRVQRLDETDEIEVKAAKPRLLANVGDQIDWDDNGEDERTRRRRHPRYRVDANVGVRATITPPWAQRFAESAKQELRAQQMTEPQVSLYQLS